MLCEKWLSASIVRRSKELEKSLKLNTQRLTLSWPPSTTAAKTELNTSTHALSKNILKGMKGMLPAVGAKVQTGWQTSIEDYGFTVL